MMKRYWPIALGIVLIVAGVVYELRGALALKLMTAAAGRAMSADAIAKPARRPDSGAVRCRQSAAGSEPVRALRRRRGRQARISKSMPALPPAAT